MTTLQFQVSSISELRAWIDRQGVGCMQIGAYLTRDQMKGFITAVLEKVPAQEFSAWMDELFPELAKTNVNEEMQSALRGCLSLLECYVSPCVMGDEDQCIVDARAALAKAA